MSGAAAAPSLRRRLACAAYDALLLLAVWLVAAFPFVALSSSLPPTWARAAMQFYLFLVAGAYFSVFWRKGQTLAMKTWRIRIVDAQHGGMPSWPRLWLRYALAGLNLACLGCGWWLALLRHDRQFMQDRLAGTRLVNSADPASRQPPAPPLQSA